MSATEESNSTQVAEADSARSAGRGGVALLAGKVFFLLAGLVQQIALKQILGLGGYGAYSTASSLGSVCYNPLVAAGIQGVSRQVAGADESSRTSGLGWLLRLHGLLALVAASLFFAVSTTVARALGAPHLGSGLQILAGVLLLYGLYAPLVGYLNGRRRFAAQAGLDAFSAAARTLGLLSGAAGAALVFSPPLSTETRVASTMLGFVFAALTVLLVALWVVGPWGNEPKSQPLRGYARSLAPIWGGQVLLNLLFQADGLLLRRFAADAAERSHLLLSAADPFVGAYRASQLFCFLPFQLLTSITLVLFPLVAAAQARACAADLARLVDRGMRISLLLAGLMVTSIVAVPSGLLTLVFQQETSLLASASMRILGVGMGFFAVFGVATAALNSLGRERQSFLLVFAAAALVLLNCVLFVRGSSLSAELLTRTAAATSFALVVATLVSLAMLSRASQARYPVLSLGRVLLAGGASSAWVAWLLPTGPIMALLGAVLASISYLSILYLLGELSITDARMLAALTSRQSAKK